MDLNKLQEVASNCRACSLYKGRLNPVFHKGNPNARIFICGMVPAYDENREGLPFVGRAGKLLDIILKDAVLTLDDVYVTNLVKCFLAPGKKLIEDWINNCLPYLIVQISLVSPLVVVTLGADASINFLMLPEKTRIGAIKYEEFYKDGISVLPTYHPSYLLRSGGEKHVHYSDVVDAFVRAKNIVNKLDK